MNFVKENINSTITPNASCSYNCSSDSTSASAGVEVSKTRNRNGTCCYPPVTS